LTADDHEILRAGIVSVLSAMAEITIADEANTAETAGALFEQSPTNSKRQ
jgi:DNA-binding NarL/FixJ family response regulator